MSNHFSKLMIEWINKQINLLTNKNKNVIIYPDTLEKRNRRLEETTCSCCD